MKFNRILIVGLILAIFEIGAVSASDDIISDENLTVETSVYDSSIQIDDSNENISVVADDCEQVETLSTSEIAWPYKVHQVHVERLLWILNAAFRITNL